MSPSVRGAKRANVVACAVVLIALDFSVACASCSPALVERTFATGSLRASPDIASFLVDPIGAYVMRRSFCFWQVEGANGVIVWGAPDVSDVAEMCRVFDVALVSGDVGRHVSLVDTCAISGVDRAAFEALLEHLLSRRDAWAAHVERQALVVERGLFGASLAGLFVLLSPRYPSKSFVDADEALSWLAPPDLASARRAYEAVRGLAVGVPDVVRRLRGLLDAERRVLRLSEAAVKLGVTPRTLQRHLLVARTSMRDEARAFRLRWSAELLTTSDLPVARVARTVGITEAQLAKLFRTVHRLSPLAFRARARNGRE